MLVGCNNKVQNPEYKNFYIVGNDTIAEIFIPEDSETGVLILWPKGMQMPKEEIEKVCNALVAPEECTRITNDDFMPKTKPTLYVHERSNSLNDEALYLEDENYLYYFGGFDPELADEHFGSFESKAEIEYGKYTEFPQGMKFKLNGKLVKVEVSSQYVICFYTPQPLSQQEAILIGRLIGKYGKHFTLKMDSKCLAVDPQKRRNYYFFDTENTDFKMTSIGNYMSILGTTIMNMYDSTQIEDYEIESLIEEGKSVEDYFDFENV